MLFQFTPLREGRRLQVLRQFLHLLISIHAPPRGATRDSSPSWRASANFNSRPSARGDLPFCVLFSCLLYFNSRPSARGDAVSIFMRTFCDISIHAPPRGATGRAHGNIGVTTFQFTPLREGRLPTRVSNSASIYFNSRPSARGDRSHHSRTSPRGYFNSRPSARGDSTPDTQSPRIIPISIHAPPRGATRTCRPQK